MMDIIVPIPISHVESRRNQNTYHIDARTPTNFKIQSHQPILYFCVKNQPHKDQNNNNNKTANDDPSLEQINKLVKNIISPFYVLGHILFFDTQVKCIRMLIKAMVGGSEKT